MRSWTDAGRAGRIDARGRSGLRPLRVSYATAVVWLALVIIQGCAVARSGTERRSPDPPTNVVLGDAIAASGAKTAWDAIRLTVRHVQVVEAGGQPARIQRRGHTSLNPNDDVVVILDNVRLTDLRSLQAISAADLLLIEFVDAREATSYIGTSSASGVIAITTKKGP